MEAFSLRESRELTRQEMVRDLGNHVNTILRENLYELNLNERQLKRLSRQKKELRENLGRCGMGDDLAKDYIVEFVQECLLKLYHLNESKMQEIFYYSKKEAHNVEYEFDRLLYIYKKQYGKDGFDMLVKDCGWLANGQNQIDEEQIHRAYDRFGRSLCFVEQLELLAWKIYSAYKGLGIIDELRDMNIDGVSGGVSGLPGDYKSVWIFYHGRSVHMSFLDFGSEEEPERA